MTKAIAIIQGRMSSSRLPGKVLLDLGGQPMLQRVIERVKLANKIDEIIVATSADTSDDPIEFWCKAHGIACYRGSLHDVLDRFHGAAIASAADVIVRVTADCPFIDPALIDTAIGQMDEEVNGRKPDFCANRLPPPFHRTYPIGLDVEVCTFAALHAAWQDAKELFHREHVMPYLYEGTDLQNLPNGNQWGISKAGFCVAVLNSSVDHGEVRWTVDTAQDLQFAKEMYSYLPNNITYSWQEMLAITQRHPEIAAINANVQHKTMTDIDERAKK